MAFKLNHHHDDVQLSVIITGIMIIPGRVRLGHDRGTDRASDSGSPAPGRHGDSSASHGHGAVTVTVRRDESPSVQAAGHDS